VGCARLVAKPLGGERRGRALVLPVPVAVDRAEVNGRGGRMGPEDSVSFVISAIRASAIAGTPPTIRYRG